MSERSRKTPTLSRSALEELGALQASVQKLGVHRKVALRLFFTSRYAVTAMAQRDFWLDFSRANHQYRVAVRRLAEFCAAHRERCS